MGKLKVQDHTGHSTIDIDKANPASLANAQAKFDEIMGKGAAAFEGTPGDRKQVKSLNPDADTLLIMPLQGG